MAKDTAMVNELEALKAQLAAAHATIADLQTKKGGARPAITVPEADWAPEGTPLGKLHRANRHQQSEALAKFGRMVDPITMCAWGLELAERAAEATGKTVSEVMDIALTTKERNRKNADAPKVIDDQTTDEA